MSSKVPCYLRTLRREWNLSQEELAFLVGKGDRNRVSRVEWSEVPPNAGEILAYTLIFGFTGQALFPALHAEIEEKVMQRAYHLYQSLEDDESPEGKRKRELLERMLARATGKANPTGV